MKKTENKMTLGRAFRANNRALKLIYKHYPQMVISHLISVIWNALTPYDHSSYPYLTLPSS